MREIADAADLSVGNLYHHFENKEEIFRKVLEAYWKRLTAADHPLNRIFQRAAFPDDLEEMAEAIERVVEENSADILLIYVDVIEFRGEHIRAFYEGMAERFRQTYSERFEEKKAGGEFTDVNPLTAVMVASRWLFYFYTVEKCFGVPMHFGMGPQEAVTDFIRLIRYGLLRRPDETPCGQPARALIPDTDSTSDSEIR